MLLSVCMCMCLLDNLFGAMVILLCCGMLAGLLARFVVCKRWLLGCHGCGGCWGWSLFDVVRSCLCLFGGVHGCWWLRLVVCGCSCWLCAVCGLWWF